jgi:hypothetical protein
MVITPDINTGGCVRSHTYPGNCFDICYQNVRGVFRSDRASVNETRGGGVLIALSSRVRSYKRRYGLEFYDDVYGLKSPL